MGQEAEDVSGKEITLEGLPEKYDPEQLASTLRQAFGQVSTHLATPAPAPASPAAAARYPDWTNVKRIAIASALGAYGGSADARVAYPTTYEGGGLSRDGQAQRFRFDTGVQLPPMIRLPLRTNSWVVFSPFLMVHGPGLSRLSFGVVVPGIRHDLRRIPERVTSRSSAGRTGPSGQLVKTGGDASYYPIGTNTRADIDFVPVFGRTPEDVEYQLKHLFSFTGGLFGQDDLVGTFPDASVFENPTLLRSFASELVTTEDRFGGILLATAWGMQTVQAGVDVSDAGGPVVGKDGATAWLRNSVNTVPDGMVACALPDLGGKALFSLPITNATLSTYLGTGLRLVLSQGTVDFVLE